MDKNQALRLYIILSRTYRAASEMDKNKIRTYGLSPSEFGVLELIMHKGPQPIQELARKVLLTSGSMTYVVSQLEKKKLVRRSPSEIDRRVFYVELTVRGSAMMAEIFPAHESFIHGMMNCLSGEDAEALTEKLKHLGISIEGKDIKESYYE